MPPSADDLPGRTPPPVKSVPPAVEYVTEAAVVCVAGASLPGGHRVVLEVDGMHHHARGTVADPLIYAKTMRGDRELKLARYDVFRFGAADLQDAKLAREMLRDFFVEMFRTYNVI